VWTNAPYEPLVSVLTPSFNQARWLADNLRSVACQTYPRVEHIVMDGGSNDGSRDLLQATGPTVRWKSEPDRGQSHALNKAFAESGGDVIGWVNSDDAYFDCRVVEDVVRFFARNPAVDVVYGHAAYVNADGRILHYLWAPPFQGRMLRLLDYIRQPTVFLRRRALGDHLVDESYEFAMDYELWLRLAQRHTFARFDRVIAVDRVQPERKSDTLPHVMNSDVQRLAAAYGVVVSPAVRPLLSAHHVYCRFRGAPLAVTDHGELAFSGRQDGWSAVLRRQVASRRSTMPVSDR
jgi:glycosyltransferase involved in cell wall biosynthesis